MADLEHTHSLPDDSVLAALGRVAIRHAQLETQLVYCIKTIAGLTVDKALDDYGLKVRREVRNAVKDAVAKHITDTTQAAAVIGYLERVEDLSKGRNALIHGYWIELSNGRRVIERGGYFVEPDAASINAFADEIDRLRVEINNARLKGWLHGVQPKNDTVTITTTTADSVTSAVTDRLNLQVLSADFLNRRK